MRQSSRIAVLGGGMAGAAACLRLCQCGERPLWIAPHASQADKPGELLSAAARPLLATLGAAWLLEDAVHRPAHSILSAWGSPHLSDRSGIVHLEGPQTVLDRTRFEADLVALAETAGPEKITAPVVTCHRTVEGWRITFDGGTADAGFVIDATGRKALVGRDQAPRFRADRLAAVFGFLNQAPGSDVEPTPATLIESVQDGWLYATLLADGRLALNAYMDADLLRPAAGEARPGWNALLRSSVLVRRWIDEAGFQLPERGDLASAATTWLAPCAGPGWLAAGDAAAAFDPLSSHGMTSALWTGIQGADAARAALSGDHGALAAYAGKVAAGVQDFLIGRERIYRQEQRFSEAEFWRRRHIATTVAAHSGEMEST